MRVTIELEGDRELLERISWWIGYNATEDYIEEHSEDPVGQALLGMASSIARQGGFRPDFGG